MPSDKKCPKCGHVHTNPDGTCAQCDCKEKM